MIRQIDLFDNNLDDECMESLGKLVQSSKSLEVVDIGSSRITSTGLNVLSESMKGNTTIRYIGLSKCRELNNKAFSLLLDISFQHPKIMLDVAKSSLMNQKSLLDLCENFTSGKITDISLRGS